MQGAPKGPNLMLLHPGLKCGDSIGACPSDPRMFSKGFSYDLRRSEAQGLQIRNPGATKRRHKTTQINQN